MIAYQIMGQNSRLACMIVRRELFILCSTQFNIKLGVIIVEILVIVSQKTRLGFIGFSALDFR